MDTCIRWIWAVAAMAVVACLIALGHAGGGPAPRTAAVAPVHASGEYFTMRDPVRGTVDYGFHGRHGATIYASTPAR